MYTARGIFLNTCPPNQPELSSLFRHRRKNEARNCIHCLTREFCATSSLPFRLNISLAELFGMNRMGGSCSAQRHGAIHQRYSSQNANSVSPFHQTCLESHVLTSDSLLLLQIQNRHGNPNQGDTSGSIHRSVRHSVVSQVCLKPSNKCLCACAPFAEFLSSNTPLTHRQIFLHRFPMTTFHLSIQ